MNPNAEIELMRRNAAAKHAGSGAHRQARRYDDEGSAIALILTAKLIVIGAAVVLAIVIGYGVWTRFVEDAELHAAERNAIRDCKADGFVPKVERDAKGRTLAVLCNRLPEERP